MDILEVLTDEEYSRYITTLEREFGLPEGDIVRKSDRFDWDDLVYLLSDENEGIYEVDLPGGTLEERYETAIPGAIKVVAEFLGKNESDIDPDQPFEKYVPFFKRRKFFENLRDSDSLEGFYCYIGTSATGCWLAPVLMIFVATIVGFPLARRGISYSSIAIACFLAMAIGFIGISMLIDRFFVTFLHKNLRETVTASIEDKMDDERERIIGEQMLRALLPYLNEKYSN